MQYLIEKCSKIFHDLRREDNIVKFGFAERVYSIKFCGGFGQLIGFSNDEFHAAPFGKNKLALFPEAERSLTTFRSNALTLMHYDSHNLHIFSNICKNVEVGNSKLPLLKSVSMDTSPASGVHGYMRNIIVACPAYVAVRNRTISKVHIDIRNCAGQKVAFQNGSTTVITLYFKCS